MLYEAKHRFAEQSQALLRVPLCRGVLPLDLLLALGGGGSIWVLHIRGLYFPVGRSGFRVPAFSTICGYPVGWKTG